MYDSIETYEKYKGDKKILKEIEKSKEKLQKRAEYYKQQKEKYLAKQQLLIEEKNARRMERDKSKINLSFEKKVRKLQWKKPLKKHQKEVTTSQLKKELYKAVQLLARLQEVDQYGFGKCISCWKSIHRTQGDGWHYIPREHMETAFDLRNIHLQCKNCNGRLHGNLINYRASLVAQYWEDFVTDLEQRKYWTRNFSKEELEALIAQTNWLIELEKKKFI